MHSFEKSSNGIGLGKSLMLQYEVIIYLDKCWYFWVCWQRPTAAVLVSSMLLTARSVPSTALPATTGLPAAAAALHTTWTPPLTPAMPVPVIARLAYMTPHTAPSVVHACQDTGCSRLATWIAFCVTTVTRFNVLESIIVVRAAAWTVRTIQRWEGHAAAVPACSATAKTARPNIAWHAMEDFT